MSKSDELVNGVIREFLKRKKLEDVLKCFDLETPRTENTIGSFSELIGALGAADLVKQNKRSKNKLSSLLEILIQRFHATSSSVPIASGIAQTSGSSRGKTLDDSLNQLLQNTTVSKQPSTTSVKTKTTNQNNNAAPIGDIKESGKKDNQKETNDSNIQEISKKKFAFTAPDGKGFDDRQAYRKYVFNTFYTFRDKTDDKLIKYPGDIDGQPFNIENVKSSEICLLDHSATVQIDLLQDCKVFVGPCMESVFIRDCKNCTFTIACKQLRTRDCENCTIRLYVKTDPIIESSHRMIFQSFNGAYPGLDKHFQSADLDASLNKWRKVFDFNSSDASIPQPHFIIDSSAPEPWVLDLSNHPSSQALGFPINPTDPTSSSSSPSSKTIPTKSQNNIISSTPISSVRPTQTPISSAPVVPPPSVPSQVPTARAPSMSFIDSSKPVIGSQNRYNHLTNNNNANTNKNNNNPSRRRANGLKIEKPKIPTNVGNFNGNLRQGIGQRAKSQVSGGSAAAYQSFHKPAHDPEEDVDVSKIPRVNVEGGGNVVNGGCLKKAEASAARRVSFDADKDREIRVFTEHQHYKSEKRSSFEFGMRQNSMSMSFGNGVGASGTINKFSSVSGLTASGVISSVSTTTPHVPISHHSQPLLPSWSATQSQATSGGIAPSISFNPTSGTYSTHYQTPQYQAQQRSTSQPPMMYIPSNNTQFIQQQQQQQHMTNTPPPQMIQTQSQYIYQRSPSNSPVMRSAPSPTMTPASPPTSNRIPVSKSNLSPNAVSFAPPTVSAPANPSNALAGSVQPTLSNNRFPPRLTSLGSLGSRPMMAPLGGSAPAPSLLPPPLP
eukprot:TRINITY_DN218_c5_g1_i1.p1 TRINITY_DN218_c5_g1~~TRINITY_DN218_c5_g1_i1.p1  ORF type:complete len:874 (+),score=245.68 TRINITY_DN218_c5_g1_i1:123-2624(+)